VLVRQEQLFIEHPQQEFWTGPCKTEGEDNLLLSRCNSARVEEGMHPTLIDLGASKDGHQVTPPSGVVWLVADLLLMRAY
jgi:hypothetical protein